LAEFDGPSGLPVRHPQPDGLDTQTLSELKTLVQKATTKPNAEDRKRLAEFCELLNQRRVFYAAREAKCSSIEEYFGTVFASEIERMFGCWSDFESGRRAASCDVGTPHV